MRDEYIDQIRRFYEMYRQEVYTYALSITQNVEAAEDVIHTVFCRLLDRGRPPRELRPYVFRSIRNASIDEMRRRVAHPDSVGRCVECNDTVGDSIFANHNGTADPHIQFQLDEAMHTLSDDERESIVLKIYDGMTFKEIAALRRVSINTAASWYRRGLEKMKTVMKEACHERD
jgi:RNA polymerase sigma-70 factor (ECF subfamily)